MTKKKADVAENPADLTEEEQAVESEMMEDSDDSEVVAEEEAQGDEPLSTDEPKAEEPAKAEETTPEEPAKAEPTTVPLAALDSERHKRKDAELREAELKGQLAALLAPKPAETESPEEMPDPVVDPEGFKGWMDRRDAKSAQPVQQITAQMRQQQEFNDLRSFATASETTFTTENADYPKALDYARDLKAKEFRMWGYPEEQIPQLVNLSEAQVAALAKERGVNPAQIVYNYAKLHGYQVSETKGESPGEKITRLEKTQKTTQSTAGAGGTPREDDWTPERIADLSDNEMADLPDEVFERVMGG